jgi:hypothetical protein
MSAKQTRQEDRHGPFAGARVLPLALEIIEAPDEHSATALNLSPLITTHD